MRLPDSLEPQNRRRSLASSDLLVADEFEALHHLAPSGGNDCRQFAIPIAGAFEYQVGSGRSWLDPSRLLFAEAGEEFTDHHPIPGLGHTSVILTPSPALLEELSRSLGAAYADRVRSCPLRIQMLVQILRRSEDPLARDEIGGEIILSCLGQSSRVAVTDTRCVRMAKSLLHAAAGERLSLQDIAAQLEVSPIYLTQAFKRAEGVPLYRFQTRLRLTRALADLPERDDITDLALELGFSSHSHFTATFKSALGVTPSDYRRGAMAASEASARLAA